MKKDTKLLSLCLAVMLSAPLSSMAQQDEHKVNVPFGSVTHPARAMKAPTVNNGRAAKEPQEVVKPAWTALLNDESVFNQFTIVDNNKDGTTWFFYREMSGAGNACYKYNSLENADDWLISPMIELKAGTNYNIKFHTRANSSYYKEKLKVSVGTEQTNEGMEAGQDILPTTEIGGDTVFFSKTFTPEKDGNYCIGFHAETEADHNRLYVYDLTVEEGAVDSAPEAPTGLQVVADETGDPKARISFVLPTKTVAGTDLTTIDSVVVKRNGEMLATLKDTDPGSRQTFDDENVVHNGNNTYTVAAYAGGNKGKEASASAFVGVDKPLMPESLVIKDNKTHIGAAWKKVTEGANKGRINPEKIVYKLCGFDDKNQPTVPVQDVQGKTETDIDVNTGEGKQRILQYAVAASNAGGQSDFVYSNAIIVGAPDILPYRDSFNDGFKQGFSHFWWMDGEGMGYDYGVSTIGFDTSSSDDDGSCIKFTSIAYNDKLNFKTGKIKLENSDRMKAVFSYRSDGAKFAQFNLMVVMPDGSVLPLKTFPLAEATEWTAAQVDLPSYLGQLENVMFQFQLEATGAPDVPQVVYLDNVNVAVASNKDVAVSMVLPEKVQRGKKTSLKVKVKNYGSEEAKDYTLTVKAGDETIFHTTISKPLPPFCNTDIQVELTPNILFADEELPMTAEIAMDGDEQPENNTAMGVIDLFDYKGSTVRELTGKNTEEGVSLSWTAPETKNEMITEDFESYEPWLTDNIGDWTTVDNDQEIVGSLFSDLQLPHEHEKYAFMVTNFEQDYQAGSYFPGHSGYSYLSSIYCINSDGTEYRANDNWLISPDLSGNAQTITFYALNHNANDKMFSENINVLYSTTDTKPGSFHQLANYTADKGEWQEFTAELPAGAIFFAIQSTNEPNKCNWLAIDDISFERGTGSVTGYNVYRDGTLLTTVKDLTSYVDKTADEGEHTYQVTVLYSNGNESAPVAVIVSVTMGMESLTADAARPTDIYDLTGRLIRRNATSLKGLPRGIYVIGGQKYAVK